MMKNIVWVSLLAIVQLNCDGLFVSSAAFDPCPKKATCGNGCMPLTSVCCANGSGYCDSGKTCTADNKCVSGGGSSGGSGGSSGGGVGGGGGIGGVTTNCICPGNEQCSQTIACVQSCTCYYTINGSDGSSAWYIVKTSNGAKGTCYMCDQNGLSPSCDTAANAAAQAATGLLSAGSCATY